MAILKMKLHFVIEKDSFSSSTEKAYRTNFSLKDMIRELYIDINYDPATIRIGRQQVVWGEAVGLRITDVINPQDFREFILDDYIDRRIPLWMLKTEYNAGDLSIESLFIPDFEPNIPARQGSEWETESSPASSGTTIIKNSSKEPDDGFKNSEWGLRLSYYLGGWDIAANYFYSWNDGPVPSTVTDQLNNTKTISPEYNRIHNIGFTFNNAFGKIVIIQN